MRRTVAKRLRRLARGDRRVYQLFKRAWSGIPREDRGVTNRVSVVLAQVLTTEMTSRTERTKRRFR